MARMRNGNPDASQDAMQAGIGHAKPEAEYPTNERGQRICGAKKRGGGRCQSTKVRPNGRCRMHGGHAASGPNHGNWKGGKYAKNWLPADILDAAQRDMEDPEFRKADLALSLLNRAMQVQATRAFKGRKPEAVAAAFKALGDLAVKRSKVLTEESRRAAASADAISRVKVGVIMGAFAQIVRQTIVDSPYVTDAGRLLADLQGNWRKGSAPMRVNGLTIPAEARGDEIQQRDVGLGEADPDPGAPGHDAGVVDHAEGVDAGGDD